ncbi:8-oxo-dGDP phosphatase NUDT18-like [Babylonia areolata]|uniref:8-oxo-dGDP phosphatase NUDT18-like n=1 Tax=Babylonia areolata TaxID=304850 RepID=UPI003FCF0B66
MAEGQSVDSDPVTHDLKQVMAGQAVPVNTIDVQREAGMKYVPKTKQTQGYIVMTVVFDEQGKVLLVEEAKLSCRGTWYLPAGRLEPGENIIDGAKREIVEEAGLECDISTMLSLLFPIGHWMRLHFYGTVTGGRLKTLEQQDKESLQAAFFDLKTVFNFGVNLRKNDILPVIREALEYRQSLSSAPLHPLLLPVISPHPLMIHRLVLVADCADAAGLHILAGISSSSGTPHLLTTAIGPSDNSLLTTVHAVLTEAFGTETDRPKTKFRGLLGVEHCGTGHRTDGMCITTLVSLVVPDQRELPAVRSDSFSWVAVRDESCSAALREALSGSIVKVV